MVNDSNVRHLAVGHTHSNEPLFQYVKPNSGYHSLEDKSIMPNVLQKATYTQTKLQLHLSKCNISFQWTLFTKGPIHYAQHPVKCHT